MCTKAVPPALADLDGARSIGPAYCLHECWQSTDCAGGVARARNGTADFNRRWEVAIDSVGLGREFAAGDNRFSSRHVLCLAVDPVGCLYAARARRSSALSSRFWLAGLPIYHGARVFRGFALRLGARAPGISSKTDRRAEGY